MKRRRKRRASPASLICLLAFLACIVALRISVSEETAASAQMTGKLENPATTAPVRLLEAEMTEAEQVTRAEDRPARAARYVNIEMTDEDLAELAAVVFLEAGNQSAEGQQAVVEVVFNRVLHSAFPDSVHDVLHQGEDGDVPQFSTIYAVSTATPTQAQYDAINGALYGDTILDADVVFLPQRRERPCMGADRRSHLLPRIHLEVTSMTRKRFRQACGIIAALGFLLVLGTAGASDCDLIPMSQILRQGCIGLGMFAGGLWLGGYLS
ncbi:MAG: cell wall hydrolase [Oscillospiraceae bacterium]